MDNACGGGDAACDMGELRPHRHVGYRLGMLRNAWLRHLEVAFTPCGLTHLQFFMLRTLAYVALEGQAPSQSRLADELRTDRMTASTVLRTLEAKGLVTRAQNPSDPRANHVVMTCAGEAAMRLASRIAVDEQARFFGRLGPERQSAFNDMLGELLDLAMTEEAT